jgi:hypothetical protein
MTRYDKLSAEEKINLYNDFLQNPDSFYEKAQTDQLKNALERNYKERFFTMTRLMKFNLMLSKAKITRTKFTSNPND